MTTRGRIGFRIAERERTIAASEIEPFRALPVAAVADAQGKLAGVTRGALRRISGTVPIVAGPALTVRTAPLDNLFVHKAIDMAEPGDVIVVDAGGVVTGAIIGELVATTAAKRGVAAIVIDGAVRDVNELRQLEMSVFASGVNPLGPQKHGPGEINFPIACDGAVVRPGDLVLLDDDGMVVVRHEEIAVVAEKARAIVDHEMGRKRSIEAGDLERPWVEKTLVDLGLPEA